MSITRTWPDWFTDSYARPLFEEYLAPSAGVPDLRFLQIGAFSGDASVWLAENILTGRDSTLTDVDTWQGSSDEHVHRMIDFDEIYSYYLSRIPPNVTPHRMTSDKFFSTEQGWYDFIYVDGGHTPRQVLRDGINADGVLMPGGLLVFDDYLWENPEHPRDIPGPAIDAFMRCYEADYEVIEMGPQIWLRKQG